MSTRLVSIGEAAELLGVRPESLRRWERQGLIAKPERTAGRQRRYDLQTLKAPFTRIAQVVKATAMRKTVCYARVSTAEQRDDLGRQEEKLALFCSAKGWAYELISDVGSGLNYKKKGLQSLLDALLEGRVERLVLTHKDRLLRFGAELIFGLCDRQGVQVVLIEQTEKVPFEQELAADVIELVTVFSARLHGARSKKTRSAIAAVRQALA